MNPKNNRGEMKLSQWIDSSVALICYELNVIILSWWIETIIQSFCWEFGVQGGNGFVCLVCLWKNTVIRSRSWYHWVWHCDMESSSNQLGMRAASSCHCTFASISFASFVLFIALVNSLLLLPLALQCLLALYASVRLLLYEVSCSLT